MTAVSIFLCDVVRSELYVKPSPDMFNVQYHSIGDERLLLDVYLPPESAAVEGGANLRPAILLVHGGGWKHGRKGHMGQDAEFFSKRGYICVSVSYRLLNGENNRWPAQIQDVRRALKWMRSPGNGLKIDPNRIAALGVSAGGHIVAHLALKNPPDIKDTQVPPKCVVNVAGPSDFLLPLPGKNHQMLTQLVSELIGSDLRDGKEKARAASPVYHVQGGVAPMLIIQGTSDDIVEMAHATRLYEALKSAGESAELKLMPGEGHVFSVRGFANYRLSALAYLKRNL